MTRRRLACVPFRQVLREFADRLIASVSFYKHSLVYLLYVFLLLDISITLLLLLYIFYACYCYIFSPRRFFYYSSNYSNDFFIFLFEDRLVMTMC